VETISKFYPFHPRLQTTTLGWLPDPAASPSHRLLALTARILDGRHTRDRRPHQLSTNYLPGLECLLRSQAATLILGSTTRPHYMNQVAVLMLAAMAS
jgi:hypothetical protein